MTIAYSWAHNSSDPWTRNSKQYLVASKMKDSDITGKDGALKVALHIRNQLAMTTIQDAAVAFKELLNGVELKRLPGESIKLWTERFTTFLVKVGRKLHTACPDISPTEYLHTFMIGLLYSASNFDASEKAATSLRVASESRRTRRAMR